MFKASVMYPNEEGARFDYEYYRTTHMKLVKEHFGPFGLLKTEVIKGLSGGGDAPPPFLCVGNLYFETADGYERSIANAGAILRGDIPNFTNVKPVRLIGEVLD